MFLFICVCYLLSWCLGGPKGPLGCPEGSQGRRLNFLIQEMNREINTIGSKANDTEIGHAVIEAKEELEKVREQVQNIE